MFDRITEGIPAYRTASTPPRPLCLAAFLRSLRELKRQGAVAQEVMLTFDVHELKLLIASENLFASEFLTKFLEYPKIEVGSESASFVAETGNVWDETGEQTSNRIDKNHEEKE